MIDQLIEIIKNEHNSLENLLLLLEEQYKYIMGKNIFELDAMVEKIKICNKEVAEQEVNRRKLVGNNSMSTIVNESNNENLDMLYRSIRKLLEQIRIQKDTNELLLKQQISYNTQILNIINPRRDMKTYNSYGNLSK